MGAEKPKSGSKAVEDHDIDFSTGPVDASKFSKLPYFMRMHGSVTPSMLLPLIVVGGWATLIVCISELIYPLVVGSVLLTVLGFVVGLSLSFRSSTAYERYNDGRKLWSQLTLVSRNLARIIWVHAKERNQADVLGKATAINLILAYCLACKHLLRHEPEYGHKDLRTYIQSLNTYAKRAHEASGTDLAVRKPVGTMKRIFQWLGIPFAQQDPTKPTRRGGHFHGHLPVEIMLHLSAYVESIFENGTLKTSCHQTQCMALMNSMVEALTGCERILATPLPLAYNIVISQITWLYVLVLPFQLVATLHWIAIPGTLVAAYIILGIAAIGREIENPFGTDYNDLDLDTYCDNLAIELDIITSQAPPKVEDFILTNNNHVMHPLSHEGFLMLQEKEDADLRDKFKQRSAKHIETAANNKKVKREAGGGGRQAPEPEPTAADQV